MNVSWKRWFAWYPVKTVSGQRVWWQVIYKRKREMYLGDLRMTNKPKTEYATLFELLSNKDSDLLLLGELRMNASNEILVWDGNAWVDIRDIK